MTREELSRAEVGSIVTITGRLPPDAFVTSDPSGNRWLCVEFGEGPESYGVVFDPDHITSVAPPPPKPIGVGDWVCRTDATAKAFKFADSGTVISIDTVLGTSCAVQWPNLVHRGGGLSVENIDRLRVVATCKSPKSSFATTVADNGKHL